MQTQFKRMAAQPIGELFDEVSNLSFHHLSKTRCGYWHSREILYHKKLTLMQYIP